MYRYSLYSDSDGKPKCNDHGAEHQHLYDGRLQLYADRDHPGRYYICMGHTDRSEHHRQRRGRDRANDSK